MAVQAALIANSDAMGIVALRVGTDPLDRACGSDIAVAADVEMIACAIKTTAAVPLPVAAEKAETEAWMKIRWDKGCAAR